MLSYGGSPDLAVGTAGFTPNVLPPADTDSTFTQDASAIQADGKVLVAGELTDYVTSTNPGSYNVAVVRYNADGTLDTTFGTDGYFTSPSLSTAIPGPLGFHDAGEGIAIQADGKIVVAAEYNLSAEVFRLNTDGTLDTSFGTGGIVTLGSLNSGSGSPVQPTALEYAASVALLPGGQIAVGGEVEFPTTSAAVDTPAVEVLNADGSIDTTYGSGGFAAIAAPAFVPWFSGDPFEATNGMVAQPDGKLVLLGVASDFSTVVVRLDTNGSVDTSFGTTGEETLPQPFPSTILSVGVEADAVAVQSDGKLVLGGYGPRGGIMAIRLNADGSIDDTFGAGGYDVVDNGSTVFNFGDAHGIAIQSDGKILLGNLDALTVVRLDTDGLPDPTFGEGGMAKLPIPSPETGDFVLNVFALSDGQIEVKTYGGLYRLLGQGSEGDYDNDGISDPAVLDTTTATYTDAPSGGGMAQTIQIGDAGAGLTLPASGAYGGGGITEIAVYRPGPAVFEIQPSIGGTEIFAFGMPGIGNTLPAPGDYDDSGKTELAAYFPSLGEFIYRSAVSGRDIAVPLGIAGAGQSIPAEADYFGTGQDDFAVYLPAIGAFEIHNPVNNQDYTIPFGTPGAGNSIPVPGDYDGSGVDELAVYLPASGDLIYRPANGGADVTISIGTPGVAASIPEIGDFDGSGHDEAAVYDPATGTFVYQPAAGGSPVSISLGTAGQTLPFSLGTDSVAEEGIGSSGAPGSLVVPASVQVPLTQDVLDNLAGTLARKKSGTT